MADFSKTKVAIIGYGAMGGYHADRIKSIASLEVAGIFDIDADRNAAAAKAGLRVFGSANEVAGNADGVILSVPNDLHKPYTESFVKAGLGVMVEKPAALNSAEFASMVNTADKYKAPFTVFQNRRHDTDYLTVREIIRQNILGGVYRVESRVVGGNGIPGGWRKVKAQGGGMMSDWGVHLIDQLLLLTDSPVVSIICKYYYVTGFKVEDGFWLELEFANGLTARVVVETNTFVPAPRWRVYGYNGTAQIKSWGLDGEIVIPKSDGTEPAGMSAGNGFTRTMAYKQPNEVVSKPLPAVTVDNDAPYNNFAAMIKKGAAPIVKNGEVMRVLKVMEAAELSAKKGEAVRGKM